MEFTWWQNHHALSKPVNNIFKKEVWHLTGKTLPNSNALPPFFKETRKIDIK